MNLSLTGTPNYLTPDSNQISTTKHFQTSRTWRLEGINFFSCSN